MNIRRWLLEPILKELHKVMTTLQDVLAQSAAILTKTQEANTKMDSMKVYVDGLKEQLTAIAQQLADAIANGNPEQIQQASDNLTAATGEIDSANAEAAAIMNTESEG